MIDPLQKLIPPEPGYESAATHLAFFRPHLMQASCLEMLKMTSVSFLPQKFCDFVG
jgi:hypothetical protein